MNLNYSEDESPLALKSDFILSLCELIVGGKDGLQPIEKTIIDRAVTTVYRGYLADPRPENMPVLAISMRKSRDSRSWRLPVSPPPWSSM